MTLTIQTLDPASDGATRLLKQSDDYMGALYPADSNYLESVADLQRSNVTFLGAWMDGQLAGCGALKVMNSTPTDYGEIKRLFVLPDYRGLGVSSALMAAIEESARAQNIGLMRLEVGIHQPEALRLYRSRGYRDIGPFGHYPSDPLSIFMEKTL